MNTHSSDDPAQEYVAVFYSNCRKIQKFHNPVFVVVSKRASVIHNKISHREKNKLTKNALRKDLEQIKLLIICLLTVSIE